MKKPPGGRRKGAHMKEFVPPANWQGVPRIENYVKWCSMIASKRLGVPVEAKAASLKEDRPPKQKVG